MFLYKVLGKAISTAAPYLKYNLTILSDNIADDMQAKVLLFDIVNVLQDYDLSNEEKEALKFFKADNPHVKEYQKYIHNISGILNCVEC